MKRRVLERVVTDDEDEEDVDIERRPWLWRLLFARPRKYLGGKHN